MRFLQLAGGLALTAMSGCAILYSYGDYEDAGAGGGAQAACKTAADCPDEGRECGSPVCDSGVCTVDARAAGTPTARQEPGDCQTRVCDGTGKVAKKVDDSDVPDAPSRCTENRCDKGVLASTPAPENTPCSEGSSAVCDGEGECVGCARPEDCGASTECKKQTCNNGQCGTVIENVGAPCQAGGACMGDSWSGLACDAAGDCSLSPTPTPCAPYGCTDPGCRESCTTDAECASGYSCEGGVCTDCVTCGEWMNLRQTAAGMAGENLCAHSRDAFNRIRQCMCLASSDTCMTDTCAAAICDGTIAYDDNCGPCIDVCNGFHECMLDD